MSDGSMSFKAHQIWVIIPAYNESKYIKVVLRKVMTYGLPVIVVDDGSRDNTSQMAAQHATVVLTHRVNLGKGAALKTGCEFAFEQAKARAVILLDADDQHDPALLPAFKKALIDGYPVVLGVRDLSKMPVVRSISNRLGSILIWLLFGTYLPDIPSGYKAFSAEIYPQLAWTATDYSVEMELAARIAKLKLNFLEVKIPTIYHDFDRGMTMLDVMSMIGKIFAWRVKL
jgi:glycosyltransferase involved in cell wall biosynthesis